VSNNLRLAACAALTLTLSSCEWFTDFKSQPKVDPWEVVSTDSMKTKGANDTVASRGNPQFSVSVYGSTMPAFQVSHMPLPATIDSMAFLLNPTPPDDSSLLNGQKYYQINCSVCHGLAGEGDGTATKFGMPGISLVNDVTKGRTDGYIWGMIRNGRGLMPPYNRIDDMDRWDVVNYVRGLQGRLSAEVETVPVGAPGETGNKVPGPSRMGPTRAPPMYRVPKPAVSEMHGLARPIPAALHTDSATPGVRP
jgi:mono/diheme cytochrome c family protein